MGQALEYPSPRDGFDTGSVIELVEDCRDLHLPHPSAASRRPEIVDIDVPDDASQLLVGLGDYGS